jgi:hypothetical protein
MKIRRMKMARDLTQQAMTLKGAARTKMQTRAKTMMAIANATPLTKTATTGALAPSALAPSAIPGKTKA